MVISPLPDAREERDVLLPALEAVDGVDVHHAGALLAQRRLEALTQQLDLSAETSAMEKGSDLELQHNANALLATCSLPTWCMPHGQACLQSKFRAT